MVIDDVVIDLVVYGDRRRGDRLGGLS